MDQETASVATQAMPSSQSTASSASQDEPAGIRHRPTHRQRDSSFRQGIGGFLIRESMTSTLNGDGEITSSNSSASYHPDNRNRLQLGDPVFRTSSGSFTRTAATPSSLSTRSSTTLQGSEISSFHVQSPPASASDQDVTRATRVPHIPSPGDSETTMLFEQTPGTPDSSECTLSSEDEPTIPDPRSMEAWARRTRRRRRYFDAGVPAIVVLMLVIFGILLFMALRAQS